MEELNASALTYFLAWSDLLAANSCVLFKVFCLTRYIEKGIIFDDRAVLLK